MHQLRKGQDSSNGFILGSKFLVLVHVLYSTGSFPATPRQIYFSHRIHITIQNSRCYRYAQNIENWQSIYPAGWLELHLNLTVIASAIQFACTIYSQQWDPKLPDLWQHKNELCLVQLILQPQKPRTNQFSVFSDWYHPQINIRKKKQ